jgi:hypothetical protein
MCLTIQVFFLVEYHKSFLLLLCFASLFASYVRLINSSVVFHLVYVPDFINVFFARIAQCGGIPY